MASKLKLVEDKKHGNMKAFKLFFEGFYPSLCLFAKKYVDEEEVALDIVQDSFVYFWEKRKNITTVNSAKSYLFKTVKNKSLNYLRDNKKDKNIQIENLESELYFRDNIIEQETYQIIYKEIKVLSPQSQRVIELSLDGLKNHEIAEQLKISVNTVKTIKMRAFKSLREKLKDQIFSLFIICFS